MDFLRLALAIGMMDLVQLEIKEKARVYGFGFFLYDILNRFNAVCINARKDGVYRKI